jgi:uncharacterized small protein (DUF1192 family)
MDATSVANSEQRAHALEVSPRPTPPVGLPLALPIIPDAEQTPTVLLLLAIIADQNQRLAEQDQRRAEQDQRLAELTAEIARLKGDQHKPRSNSKPSSLLKPPAAQGQRPGSDKRRPRKKC